MITEHDIEMWPMDALSFSVLLASVSEFLNPVAVLFTIVWTGFRIYETKTVQRWLGRDESPSAGRDCPPQ